MTAGDSGGLDLIDLREAPTSPLLRDFIALYDATFTDEAEREDPGQWAGRLASNLAPPQPRSHLLLAGEGLARGGREIRGGIVFEHYRESRCGLLTYVVVDPRHRRSGLGGRLVAAATATLEAEAQALGAPLRAVFGEAEDPAQMAGRRSAMPPADRLAAFAALGARRIPFAYVQPELDGGQGRARHLHFLAFPLGGRSLDSIEGAIVRDFLHEFYRALGVRRPEEDPDFRAMSRSLAGRLPLAPPGGSSA
ncbi:MAG: GNAT family N-acetyltransferase [Alphaproteobacteria bacterium]|nr:GNAT family N-acetyltransferase [Alphaproteobacteria bacterium]